MVRSGFVLGDGSFSCISKLRVGSRGMVNFRVGLGTVLV